jgi:hypothetical protein
VLPILLGAMAFSVIIYIGLTYLAPVPSRPMPSGLHTALLALAVLAMILGIVIEGILLRRADTPAAVQSAAIVSAAFGESCSVFGLMVFFMSGQRDWLFFLLSALYFARLFLRLPDFLGRMDEMTR